MRQLGTHQIGVLKSLVEHGTWNNVSSGWRWGYITKRVLDSLVRLGLASVVLDKSDLISIGGVSEYAPTKAGIEEARRIRGVR